MTVLHNTLQALVASVRKLGNQHEQFVKLICNFHYIDSPWNTLEWAEIFMRFVQVSFEQLPLLYDYL